MGWYDVFSRFYDSSLEKLYLEHRALAVQALQLSPGQVVLDLPCGTGQSLDGLSAAVGADGLVIGADFSEGMLKRAQTRTEKRGLTNVALHQTDVHALDDATLSRLSGGRPLDRLQVFLSMSAFPNHEVAFERLWSLLRPGGGAVVATPSRRSSAFRVAW